MYILLLHKVDKTNRIEYIYVYYYIKLTKN